MPLLETKVIFSLVNVVVLKKLTVPATSSIWTYVYILWPNTSVAIFYPKKNLEVGFATEQKEKIIAKDNFFYTTMKYFIIIIIITMSFDRRPLLIIGLPQGSLTDRSCVMRIQRVPTTLTRSSFLLLDATRQLYDPISHCHFSLGILRVISVTLVVLHIRRETPSTALSIAFRVNLSFFMMPNKKLNEMKGMTKHEKFCAEKVTGKIAQVTKKH